ncbi:luciferase domain-containing protein [Haloprofundus halophilus]|uniref:luciferase domain-containing protein n=1 Tax=Haloprofundus halophilus TaxID=2283527 RepID=UPI000E44A066|nr:luciferase family protein [Haloprofundus halophilus]
MSSTTPSREQLVDELTATAATWPGIEVAPHRFEGNEFTLGPREVGHVHRFGILDINYPRRLRDTLIDEGRTGEHHVVPDSGWTTFRIRTGADLEPARWLLRLSYLYHVATLRRRPELAGVVGDVDVEGELDAMSPSPRVRESFDRVLD